jgi:hypothetical protein
MGTPIVSLEVHLVSETKNQNKMKNKSKTQDWAEGAGTPESNQLSQISKASFHQEYANEGDEFVDDNIRIVEQPFVQVDGSFEVWQRRSKQVSGIENEIINSKII